MPSSTRILFLSSAAFLCLAWFASRALDAVATEPGREPPSAGKRILSRANDLLNSLGDDRRRKVTFDYGDEERFNWHFIPRERKGIPLRELGESQRSAVQALLRSALSELGYERAEQVRVLEGVLRELEGSASRDPELYYLTVFGKPAAKGRWGWRFEGHHLSLNFSLDGERLLSATPLFYGANPATVRKGPRKGLRVLGGMEDVARQLVSSLDESQRRSALGEGPEEVKGTRSPRYSEPLPEGLTADKLNPEQRGLLDKLIREYTKNLKEQSREKIEREIRAAGPAKTHFAWRGGMKPFEGHSYMVHGPSFVISYANFQGGATHIHAALRNTAGEFGLQEKVR